MMKTRVKNFIREYGLIERGDRVLCALSAGADSVFMVCILHELMGEMGFSLSAAHFSHGLRPLAAEFEKNVAKNLCSRLEIELYHEKGDTPAYCEKHKLGWEEGARALRYAFFDRGAMAMGANKIATAHNMNDNAETLILNLLRGTGLKGLSGIPVVRDNIIRPILCVERLEIEEYLKKGDKPYEFVVDETNASSDYTRNRLRNEVFPRMGQINDRYIQNISACALRVREENEDIESRLESFFEENAKESGGEIAFSAPLLKAQSSAFLKRIVHRAYQGVGGDMGKLGSVHIESVCTLAREKLPPKYIVMPDYVRARLEKKQLIFSKKS